MAGEDGKDHELIYSRDTKRSAQASPGMPLSPSLQAKSPATDRVPCPHGTEADTLQGPDLLGNKTVKVEEINWQS